MEDVTLRIETPFVIVPKEFFPHCFHVNSSKLWIIVLIDKNSIELLFVSSFQTEQFTVLWILFATIVLGNSAVLITLYLNKRKSRMNFFIKQLAFAGKYLLQ